MNHKQAIASPDETMMRRALELARQGVGQVSPSPMVGCVIVSGDGSVVGEGCFLFQDIKHAETIALEQAGLRADGGTAYISLEPHAHHGRTPPCTEALINAQIRRVVAPIEDPNPLVSGKGFAHLREAGLEVSVGVLASEAAQLNEKYIHFMNKKRPFVHLKLAMSMDGRIATRTGDSKWITGEESRAHVHHLRHEYDAILIGSGTASKDDPLLTDRSGLKRRKPILRVLLDSELGLSPESKLCKTARDSPVLIFATESADRVREKSLTASGVEVFRSKYAGREMRGVLTELARRSIQSVLVEGGAMIAGALLDSGLIDKISFFIAPIIIGGNGAVPAVGGYGAGRIADAVRLENITVTRRGCDIEITGYPGTRMKEDG